MTTRRAVLESVVPRRSRWRAGRWLLYAALACAGPTEVTQAQGSDRPPAFAVWTASGGQSNAHFGISAGTAGDVNGDGFADVIVGAPRFTQTLFEEGAAFVYYGSASGLPEQPSWSAYGGQKTADFGNCVASAGDVNRDGFDDVMVGVPGYTFRSGEYNVGAAFVYLGSSNGLATTPVWTAQGMQPGAQFGYSVSGGGDLNGDGYPDLIIGAPSYRESRQPVGKALVYYGSARGFGAEADWTFTGNQRRARFGHPATLAGDVNGDGFADVIIAARDYDHEGLDNAGKVWVFHGSRQGLGQKPDWTFTGRQRFGRAGFGCAAAGDVNRDGFGDVIVGAGGEGHSEEKEGAAYVFYGSAKGLTEAHWRVEGNKDGVGIGQTVGRAGDVNGDGFADVIIGAPTYNGKESNEGRAFVFHGSPHGLQTNATWVGAVNRHRLFLGRDVATAGDVNRDGFGDVIVGAMMDKTDAEGGLVRVYAGSRRGLLPTEAAHHVYPIQGHVLIPPVPPLWEQNWFRGGIALVLIGAVAAGWHIVTTTQLKRRLRLAEQARLLEEERLRIAEDLHDQLGANLTTITLLSEVARRDAAAPEKVEDHLSHISGTARDLTRALEEIVWAVNPRKNKLDQMVAYFSAYAEEFLKPTDLRCRLDFPDELPERVVPMELRHPLFLVLKEALTNVVKHAAATEVRIGLSVADSTLRLVIEDDGRGFNPGAVRNGANGLANMRSRIAHLSGDCRVSSQAGRGTRVQVEIALAGGEVSR